MTLFPILIDVEESAVGRVLRLLNKTPGIANFHLNFDNIGKPGRANGKLPPGPANSPDPNRIPQRRIVIAELMSGPKNLEHLKTKVAEHGHRPDSVNSTLNTLRKAGITESGGTGLHKLTESAMEEIKRQQAVAQPAPSPAGALAPPPSKRKPKSRGGPSATAIILRAMVAAEGRGTRKDLKTEITAQGFQGVGIDAALHALRKGKLIKASEPGVYDLTAKGRDQAAKLQPAPQQEEMPHG